MIGGGAKIHRIPLTDRSSSTTTTREVLLEVLRQLDEGEIESTGMIVISVNEHGDDEAPFLDWCWCRAGKSMGNHSRTVVWLELVKHQLLNELA
jgi:hypothetical protein